MASSRVHPLSSLTIEVEASKFIKIVDLPLFARGSGIDNLIKSGIDNLLLEALDVSKVLSA